MDHKTWKSLTRTLTIQTLVIEMQDLMVAGGSEAVELATKHVDNRSSSATLHERICGNVLIVLDKLGWLKPDPKPDVQSK